MKHLTSRPHSQNATFGRGVTRVYLPPPPQFCEAVTVTRVSFTFDSNTASSHCNVPVQKHQCLQPRSSTVGVPVVSHNVPGKKALHLCDQLCPLQAMFCSAFLAHTFISRVYRLCDAPSEVHTCLPQGFVETICGGMSNMNGGKQRKSFRISHEKQSIENVFCWLL